MSGLTKKVVALAGMSAFVAGSAVAAELTVVSWGGAYTKSQVEAYHKPWMAQSGHSIISEDYGGGIAEIKAQVESGNVTWDVVDVELSDAIRACDEGLLEEIDHSSLPAAPDGTPAVDDFLPGTLHDCAVANIVWSSVYVYDSSKVRNWNAPKTMADFFNTEAYPGKRGMRKSPKVTMEFALIADGVPTSEVYDVLSTEEGIARAFAKLDTIKDEITWYDSWSQAPVLLNDGGATMVQSANGRIFAAIKDDGAPFEIVWDSHIYDLDVWAIMKGTEKKEEAMEFIKFATGTVPLSGMQDVAYGPTRASAQALLPEEVKKDLPTAHLDEGVNYSHRIRSP